MSTGRAWPMGAGAFLLIMVTESPSANMPVGNSMLPEMLVTAAMISPRALTPGTITSSKVMRHQISFRDK